VNHKLPAIPLVPLSSTQIVIGAVIGVGWARGGKGINYRVLGKIGIGWIVAPVVSACIAFIGLFIVQNVFEQKVVESVPYRLNRATIVELKAQGIEEAPLKKLEGKKFYSSGSFRQALWNQKQWKEQELYLIFSYAHLDTIKIDSNRAKLLIESTEITPAQRQALLILHGRQFAYHWQLEKALIEGSDEWNILEGRENERHNKNVQQLKRALYDAFGRK
jgi:PiT family inorganic phosphate transporter